MYVSLCVGCAGAGCPPGVAKNPFTGRWWGYWFKSGESNHSKLTIDGDGNVLATFEPLVIDAAGTIDAQGNLEVGNFTGVAIKDANGNLEVQLKVNGEDANAVYTGLHE